MKVTATLTLEFVDPEEASLIYGALQADDDGYLEQRLEGHRIHVSASADSPGALREALEDYLSCLTAARNSLGSISQNGIRDHDGPQ